MTSTTCSDDEELISLGDIMQAARTGILKVEHDDAAHAESQAMQSICAARIAIEKASDVFASVVNNLKEMQTAVSVIIEAEKELGIETEKTKLAIETIKRESRKVSELYAEHEKMHAHFLKTIKTKPSTQKRKSNDYYNRY